MQILSDSQSQTHLTIISFIHVLQLFLFIYQDSVKYKRTDALSLWHQHQDLKLKLVNCQRGPTDF